MIGTSETFAPAGFIFSIYKNVHTMKYAVRTLFLFTILSSCSVKSDSPSDSDLTFSILEKQLTVKVDNDDKVISTALLTCKIANTSDKNYMVVVPTVLDISALSPGKVVLEKNGKIIEPQVSGFPNGNMTPLGQKTSRDVALFESDSILAKYYHQSKSKQTFRRIYKLYTIPAQTSCYLNYIIDLPVYKPESTVKYHYRFNKKDSFRLHISLESSFTVTREYLTEAEHLTIDKNNYVVFNGKLVSNEISLLIK